MKSSQFGKRTSLHINCQKSAKHFVSFAPLKQCGVRICKSVEVLMSCLHNKCHVLRILRPGDKKTDFCSNVPVEKIPEGIVQEKNQSVLEEPYALYLRRYALNEF